LHSCTFVGRWIAAEFVHEFHKDGVGAHINLVIQPRQQKGEPRPSGYPSECLGLQHLHYFRDPSAIGGERQCRFPLDGLRGRFEEISPYDHRATWMKGYTIIRSVAPLPDPQASRGGRECRMPRAQPR
jgi:hypothetical protein